MNLDSINSLSLPGTTGLLYLTYSPEIEKEIEEFNTSWTHQELALKKMGDRQQLRSEITQVTQSIYRTLSVLSARGWSQADLLKEVKKQLSEGSRELSYSLSRYSESRTSFKSSSTLFAEKTSAKVQDFSSFAPPPKPAQTTSTSNLNTRKITLESRKKELSRCIQLSMDPEHSSAIPCLAHHSEGLNPEEKKELSDYLPKAVAGNAINNIAMVPVTLKIVVESVFGFLVQGAVYNGCLNESPSNYKTCVVKIEDLLQGKNQKFNQSVQSVTPDCVISLAQFLGRQNQNLKAFDHKLHQEYGTIPGLVHEALLGSIDLLSFKAFAIGKATTQTLFRSLQEQAILQVRLQGSLTPSLLGALRPQGGKLVLKRSFWEKKLKEAGFVATSGGKGSHVKYVHPLLKDSEFAILPSKSELTPGTAKSCEKHVYSAIQASRTPQTPISPTKTPALQRNAFVERLDYSKNYYESAIDFIRAREFDGILKRDLTIIQFHSSTPLHEPRTFKWFTVPAEVHQHRTLESLQNAIAKLSSYGEMSEVTLARIPAGTSVKFLHGRAAPKIDAAACENLSGGAVQYRIYDFDPNWIVKEKPLK